MRFPNRIYYEIDQTPIRLGNRTISVNLVRNVSASDTPFAPPRL